MSIEISLREDWLDRIEQMSGDVDVDPLLSALALDVFAKASIGRSQVEAMEYTIATLAIAQQVSAPPRAASGEE
jgi:hypothetical protein